MKYRFVIALVMFILTSGVSSNLFGQKTKKHKDKRYETVVRQNLKDYAGTYVGIERDYIIEIQVTADGKLNVKNIEDDQNVPLTNIKLVGARLTADKLYPNGRAGKFEATFSNRIVNNTSAFGLLVDNLDVRLEGGVQLDRLFYPRN